MLIKMASSKDTHPPYQLNKYIFVCVYFYYRFVICIHYKRILHNELESLRMHVHPLRFYPYRYPSHPAKTLTWEMSQVLLEHQLLCPFNVLYMCMSNVYLFLRVYLENYRTTNWLQILPFIWMEISEPYRMYIYMYYLHMTLNRIITLDISWCVWWIFN